MQEYINKKLIAWVGVSGGITLDKVYHVLGEQFKDNNNETRFTIHGEWEDVVEDFMDGKDGIVDDIHSITGPSKAMRFNEGKSQLSYMLEADVAMKGMCDVFAFGAEKYDRGNWKKGLEPSEVMDSMLRHMTAYQNGEVLDPESRLPHVDHIMCNAVFLSTFGKRES